jgi:hypothetical protein
VPTGAGARCIAVADINHDKNLDLIVGNADSGTLTVFLGDGKGNFNAVSGPAVQTGPQPNDIAIADMNADGKLDVVIANHQSPYITILLGDGKGAFAPAPDSPFNVHSFPHPHGVVVGAFSGRPSLDVVTESWGNNQVELLRGNGKGGLQTPGIFFPVGRRPYERLRSADFNKDGHPDIVTTNLDDGTVSILLGDGKGGFHNGPGSPFPAGAKPWQIAIGDLNKDGYSDLVIIPYERDVTDAREVKVTVLLGDGRGRFAPMNSSSLSLQGCRGPNSVATGDVNGDGNQDVVVSCAQSGTLGIFFGSPSGRFSRVDQRAAVGWGTIAVADVNGDGKSDIVKANDKEGSVTIYFGR